MKKCPKCGAENPDNAKFCLECGYRFEVERELEGFPFPKLFTSLTLILAVTSLLDSITNNSIRLLIGTLIGAIAFVILVIGVVVILYSYFKLSGLTRLKRLMIGSLLIGVGYLIFYILPLIGNIVVVYPVWIVYLFNFLMIRKHIKTYEKQYLLSNEE